MRVPALKQERIGCCGDGGATGSGRDERSMSPPPPRERTHTTPAFAPHSSSAGSHRTPMAISETSSVQRSSLPRVMRRRVGVGVGWRARRSSTLAHPHNPATLSSERSGELDGRASERMFCRFACTGRNYIKIKRGTNHRHKTRRHQANKRTPPLRGEVPY